MRIAFVSANREKMPDAVVPLGILYVIAGLPEGHEVELIDLCFARRPLQLLEERLRAFLPDVVAVGMRNVQNAVYGGSSDGLAYYRELMATIRGATSAKIVLGGGGFSVLPEGLMRDLRPDYGIAGEGERAFADLVSTLETGRPGLAAIERLHHYRGDELVSVPFRGRYLELDTLAWPDRRLADPRYYALSGIESVQTKRGCPLHCAYCTYPLIEGRSSRLRDPSCVVDEMLAAVEAHPEIAHFFIVDSTFNVPSPHAKEVCRELARRGPGTPFTCYASPLDFDEELAGLLVEAGCAGLEVGSDSGTDAILARLGKGFTTDEVVQMHALCAAVGLRDCHTFVLGTPGETLADVERTLAFLVELDPFSAILMVYTDDAEALDAAYAAERSALREAVLELLRAVAQRHPRWIVPALHVHFNRSLFRLLRRRGLRGPLWQHVGAELTLELPFRTAAP